MNSINQKDNSKKFEIIKDKFTHSEISVDELEKTHIDILNVPKSSLIKDSRILEEFKTTAFSGPPKSKVASAMEKCIAEEKLEAANYWAFQLLLSGLSMNLWNKLLNITIKQVNIANPTFPIFLLNRTKKWEQICQQKDYQKKNVLNIRNNQEIRNMLIELVSILTLSRKRKM